MWWRPAKRIWCSECTGLGHTERRKTEARTRHSDRGRGDAREMDQVPEVRDGNRRVRQMERRKRRNRSRRQNMSEDHKKGREEWKRERRREKDRC